MKRNKDRTPNGQPSARDIRLLNRRRRLSDPGVQENLLRAPDHAVFAAADDEEQVPTHDTIFSTPLPDNSPIDNGPDAPTSDGDSAAALETADQEADGARRQKRTAARPSKRPFQLLVTRARELDDELQRQHRNPLLRQVHFNHDQSKVAHKKRQDPEESDGTAGRSKGSGGRTASASADAATTEGRTRRPPADKRASHAGEARILHHQRPASKGDTTDRGNLHRRRADTAAGHQVSKGGRRTASERNGHVATGRSKHCTCCNCTQRGVQSDDEDLETPPSHSRRGVRRAASARAEPPEYDSSIEEISQDQDSTSKGSTPEPSPEPDARVRRRRRCQSAAVARAPPSRRRHRPASSDSSSSNDLVPHDALLTTTSSGNINLNVPLESFETEDAEGWFERLEASLYIARVPKVEWIQYVRRALPKEWAYSARRHVKTLPAYADQYKAVKKLILSLTKPRSAHARRLINLPTLGKKKPSELMMHIHSLIPPGTFADYHLNQFLASLPDKLSKRYRHCTKEEIGDEVAFALALDLELLDLQAEEAEAEDHLGFGSPAPQGTSQGGGQDGGAAAAAEASHSAGLFPEQLEQRPLAPTPAELCPKDARPTLPP